MSEMPKEIFVGERADVDGWTYLEIRSKGESYTRTDTIAEASKRVSEYKVDMSKYPMLEQTEIGKKREQERAETLDRAIEKIEIALSVCRTVNRSRYHKIIVDDGECYWQTKEWVDWVLDEVAPSVNKALTELKKLRGEG